MSNLEQVVGAYVKLRDKKAELKAEQAKALAPYDEALDKLEKQVLEELNKMGVDSVKTASGTAYKSIRSSASVADKSAFMDYVRENGAFDLLDIKANKTAVEEFISEHQDCPPGVTVRREQVVGFRRA